MVQINHNEIGLSVIRKLHHKDLEYFSTLNFPKILLEELARPTRHPKVQKYYENTYLVLHFPDFSDTGEIITRELDFIILEKEIILVQYEHFDLVDTFLGNLQNEDALREEIFGKDTYHVLYNIILHILNSLFPHLDKLIHNVEDLEKNIFKKHEEESMLQRITLMRQKIMNFERIMRPNTDTLRDLASCMTHDSSEVNLFFLRELESTNRRIIKLLENQRYALSILQGTNEALLTTKTNHVMRTLTIFSVIVFPLTLAASIFGMNFKIPLFEHPNGFWIIVDVMVAGVFVMIFFFKYKRWI